LDRAAEVHRLNLANLHIAEAEQHIAEQELVLKQLRAGHDDTHEAERFLATMKQILAGFHEHRRLIVEMIEQIDDDLT
jgi:hypothetical protein